MNDLIVKRLRRVSCVLFDHEAHESDTLAKEAAIEILRLRSENARIRNEVLEEAWQAVGAALGNETRACQKRARDAIRALSQANKEGRGE